MSKIKTTFDPDWKEKYASQILNANEAVKRIRPGQRVFVGTACAEPVRLVQALAQRATELPDTEIVHLLTFGEAPYAHRELTRYFRVNSFFIAENVRGIIQEGLGDYTPIFLSDLPRLFHSGQQRLDVALIQVTPPDERGRVSLGTAICRACDRHRNTSTVLTPEWEAFINDLNANEEKLLRYIKADDTAIFNTSGFPNLESLTMGGNVITLDEIQGDWGIVHTLDLGESLSPQDVNYITCPDLVHKFVVVGWRKTTKETYWVDPPPGEMYWPLVSSRDDWISLERLEKFPDLPVKVTANQTVYIHMQPGPNNGSALVRLFKG